MNRGWGPDQRRGSNPWWAFGSLDLAQSTDTMHKNVTDLAQSNNTMHKSVPPHSVSFPTIIGVKVGVLCFSVSLWEKVDDAGFPTDSRYLISPPSTLHLLAQRGTGLFFCWQISEIIVFSSATSEPFWYLVFSHQNISRICSRSNFGSGICDKGDLGDKIGGIHSQTLILPNSMYIWKGIHQGKKIWV